MKQGLRLYCSVQPFKGCTPYAPLLLAIGLHKLILDEESVAHFLIHYEVARVLWALLLIMIGMEWRAQQHCRGYYKIRSTNTTIKDKKLESLEKTHNTSS
ncbi:unnamed protein product [Camellia sinensis]